MGLRPTHIDEDLWGSVSTLPPPFRAAFHSRRRTVVSPAERYRYAIDALMDGSPTATPCASVVQLINCGLQVSSSRGAGALASAKAPASGTETRPPRGQGDRRTDTTPCGTTSPKLPVPRLPRDEIRSVSRSLPDMLAQTGANLRPRNRAHRSRIQLSHAPANRSSPLLLRPLVYLAIQALQQGTRQAPREPRGRVCKASCRRSPASLGMFKL